MTAMPGRWSAAELLACCRAADAEERLAHPLGAGVVLLELASAHTLDASDRIELLGWLPRIPCPVIAFGDGDETIGAACDVRVATLAAAETLALRIRSWPGAARVLVQTLRAVESMPPEQALDVESLAFATLQGGMEHRAWLAAHKVPALHVADESAPLVVSRDDDTLVIELDRPSRRNAISADVRDALVEALRLLAADAGIARCVLRGTGDCFSVGGDLAEFGSVADPLSAHMLRAARSPARWLLRTAGRVEARLHGACIGAGIELPAFAARVVAGPDAWFQLPELAMGLIPGAGGCVSIPRRIGRQRTAWMVLSGRRVNATQALAWGLIDEIGKA